ncbi:unnamed protein product [Protopolystoma xenopodis]|uniref:Uncharacterized protein n=1 Tax=Protopolystoma xenopodis TaxID=117903 RepID=A0A3S5FCM9_9PLAT|nr:unnamed protein product [Protopolystoma xenopodis]
MLWYPLTPSPRRLATNPRTLPELNGDDPLLSGYPEPWGQCGGLCLFDTVVVVVAAVVVFVGIGIAADAADSSIDSGIFFPPFVKFLLLSLSPTSLLSLMLLLMLIVVLLL